MAKKKVKSLTRKLKEAKQKVRELEKARSTAWLLNYILGKGQNLAVLGKCPAITKEFCNSMSGKSHSVSGHVMTIFCDEKVDLPELRSGAIIRTWANNGLHGAGVDHEVFVPGELIEDVIARLQEAQKFLEKQS